MFSIGDDDFVVDEDFLESAFAVESNYTKKAGSPENESDCGTSTQLQNAGIKHIRNRAEREVSSVTNQNDEFVNLWNSKNDDLFFSRSPPKRVNPRNLLDIARAESPFGMKSDVVTRVSKNVVSRKFPGPAGLLPERTCNTSFVAAEEYISKIENEDKTFSAFEETEVLSQASNKLFEEPGGAWKTMMDELGPLGVKLTSVINLSTIRVKQARFGFKVPFLAVSVQNIDCSLPDPSLSLKDQQDEMHGTLHRDVWEDWKGEIVVGCVLVLRNIGVVTAGMSSRRYFLNITANNIVTIYTPKNDSSLKITQIQSVSSLDTSQLLDEWERVMSQTRQQQLSCELQPRPLFTTFSPQLQGQPSPSFRPYSSPVTGSASPAPNQRPPARPVFRPRTPLQSHRPSHNAPRPPLGSHNIPRQPLGSHNSPRQPLGSHSTPRYQFTNCSSVPQTRLPVQSASNVYNKPLEKHKHPQENIAPRESVPPKAGNSGFKLKSETFKTHFNSPKPDVTTAKSKEITVSANNQVHTTVPAKKLKISSSDDQPNKSISSVFTIPSINNSTVIDSVLEGIDTDLFFDEF